MLVKQSNAMKKKKTGRPSSYTEAAAEKICAELEKGDALHEICKRPGFPEERTVCRWLEANEAFRQRYARARAKGLDTIAWDAMRIADDPNDDPQSRRVRLDARKWLLSKLAPKKYGEKIEVEQTGEQRVRICIGGAAANDG